MANKTKLTPELQARFVEAIAKGAHYVDACNYAGISYETFRLWREAGEQAKSGAMLAFFVAVKEAEGAATLGALDIINKAADEGAWQAATWKLERRYPDRYGRTVQTQEISGPGGGPLELRTRPSLRDLSTEELAIVRNIYERASAPAVDVAGS